MVVIYQAMVANVIYKATVANSTPHLLSLTPTAPFSPIS